MQLEDIDKAVDESLRRGGTWDPPEGFARRVAAQAPDYLFAQPAVGLSSRAVARAAAPGVLAATTVYLGLEAYAESADVLLQTWSANAVPIAWVCAALSITVAAWYTRQATRPLSAPRA